MDQKRDTCLPTSLEGLYLKRALKLWLGIYLSCVKFFSPPMSHLFCSTTSPSDMLEQVFFVAMCETESRNSYTWKINEGRKKTTFLPYQLLDLTHSVTTQNMMLSNWVAFHSEGAST